LIISDVRMPGVSGLDVLATLRREDWSTPVILMTAFGDLETRAEARRLGAKALFDKPFDVDDLRTAVSWFLHPS
jgi:DNA-binding NtrC family response regulator